MKESLQRFLTAQSGTYEKALAEIKNGRKQSHWMWFIFPQLHGLGKSEASRYYGIKGLEEAEAYLQHGVLGHRLMAVCKALLTQPNRNPHEVFGSPDDMKLKSSITLFSLVDDTEPCFKKVLDEFFEGQLDKATLELLRRSGQPL